MSTKRPDKNRVYCPDCGSVKMLFATRREAELFMEYNNEAIAEENGYAPIRAYYCPACRGWHITSHEKTLSAQIPASARQKWRRMEKCLTSALKRIYRRRVEEAHRVFSIAFHLYESCAADGVSPVLMEDMLDRMTECVNLCVSVEQEYMMSFREIA